MGARYASHNDYIGFKKILHDSHHPGPEAPPLPHASTWFPNSSSSSGPSQPQQRAHGHGSSADAIQDDDDVELAETSATINIKCPLTLRPMKEPVTSLKCPHSFEKAAILDMIGRSDVFVGGKGTVGRRAQGGVRGMKCPVCETVRFLLFNFSHSIFMHGSELICTGSLLRSSSQPQTSETTLSSRARSNASWLLWRPATAVFLMGMTRMKRMCGRRGGGRRRWVAPLLGRVCCWA